MTSYKDVKGKLESINAISGIGYLETLENRYLNFKIIIDRKLTPGELMYVKYIEKIDCIYQGTLSALEQYYLSQKVNLTISEPILDYLSCNNDDYKTPANQFYERIRGQNNYMRQLVNIIDINQTKIDLIMEKICSIDSNCNDL
jgi:hypothetical protein